MIISRTPLRVSFCGGGTDIDEFSMAESSGGRVVSTAINKYVYVTMNRRFDDRIRISYSSMEDVDSVSQIQHGLVREALRLTGIESGVEITTIADIPGRGTGLGSSSSVTVGLLNAMHSFQGRNPSKEQLAEEACKIEIEIMGAPIGRQDQYAAAFGGINSIRFGDEGVTVEPIEIGNDMLSNISSNFTLVFTGMTRSASKVLSEESEDEQDKSRRMRVIRDHAEKAAMMFQNGDLDSIGGLLNETWNAKRGISSLITNQSIDELHEKVMSSGAKGAKLLGAGNGGFLLVYGDGGLRETLMGELGSEFRMFPLEIDFSGSVIIHGNQ
jgi:D-glycero-alpha-D-manno-heptose-7-phosphate kinase|tara:strand:- start:5138 stop:6118 length:981 start_codon:yes stop_codon:yes gene_type:complete